MQISKAIFIPYATVRRVCLRFEELNHSLSRLVSKRPRSFNVIPQHVKQQLLSKALLQTWSPYSLLERVELIRRQWGVQISDQTLWKFYR